jgi:DNA-binding transcriptional regulator YdaS (Cro superfamily)
MTTSDENPTQEPETHEQRTRRIYEERQFDLLSLRDKVGRSRGRDNNPDLAAISDPVERARTISDMLTSNQAQSNDLAAARRAAIDEALASGITRDQLARLLGVSGPRISQMRSTEPEEQD